MCWLEGNPLAPLSSIARYPPDVNRYVKMVCTDKSSESISWHISTNESRLCVQCVLLRAICKRSGSGYATMMSTTNNPLQWRQKKKHENMDTNVLFVQAKKNAKMKISNILLLYSTQYVKAHIHILLNS